MQMIEDKRELRPDARPRSLVSAAQQIVSVRGHERQLRAVFDESLVPMCLLDNERRIVDANRAARLLMRMSLEEARGHTVADLTPAEMHEALDQAWERLSREGSVGGTKETLYPDGSHIESAYLLVHNVLPGLHLAMGMPLRWPDDELGVSADEPRTERVSPKLTDREIEVLRMTAGGAGLQEIAEQLTISAATAKTHLRNVHRKLGARNRAHAIVIAIENGMLETSPRAR